MEAEKKTEKVDNRDLQLLKIQIPADQVHTTYTLRFSLLLVIFGLITVFYSLYLQGITEAKLAFAYAGYIGIFIILGVSVVTGNYIAQKYHKEYKRISNMIEEVNSGKQLKPLNELSNWENRI